MADQPHLEIFVRFGLCALLGFLVGLDWASFNLVLGSLANTYMKLFLVFSLGHRGLFKQCLVPFLLMGAAGVATMWLYYDIPVSI